VQPPASDHFPHLAQIRPPDTPDYQEYQQTSSILQKQEFGQVFRREPQQISNAELHTLIDGIQGRMLNDAPIDSQTVQQLLHRHRHHPVP